MRLDYQPRGDLVVVVAGVQDADEILTRVMRVREKRYEHRVVDGAGVGQAKPLKRRAADADVYAEDTFSIEVRHIIELVVGIRNGHEREPMIVSDEEERIAEVVDVLNIRQPGDKGFQICLR